MGWAVFGWSIGAAVGFAVAAALKHTSAEGMQHLAEPLGNDHRRCAGGVEGGDQRVQASDPDVAEPGGCCSTYGPSGTERHRAAPSGTERHRPEGRRRVACDVPVRPAIRRRRCGWSSIWKAAGSTLGTTEAR